jgi:glycosyltransferase involved in cell wall biosynthesis
VIERALPTGTCKDAGNPQGKAGNSQESGKTSVPLPGPYGNAQLKISVVIPAFNEELLLAETLCQVKSALRAFSVRGWKAEVIVCNNNSTDRTGELATQAGALVVFEPVNQIGRSRNTGASAATGDWLIFVDADSHPSEALFGEVAEQIASGTCLAGGCTVKLAGNYRVAGGVVGLWNLMSRAARWMAGSFIFCETAAFRSLGGFSQELFAAEEIDLSRRLKTLARQRRKRVVILHLHPVVTSPRKIQLYSARELLGFLVRTVLAGGKTLTNRDACHAWYDGRRSKLR